MNIKILFSLQFLFLITLNAISQTTCQYPETTLTPEDQNRIDNTPNKTIYTVSGTQEFSGSVLKCDNLVFQDGAKLVFTNLDQKDIIIRVKRLKINTPANKVYIERKAYDNSNLNGGDGSNLNPAGKNKRGKKGNHGGNGKNGPLIPTLKIVIDNSEVDFGQIGEPSLVINWNGIDGGNGGNGGKGQKGGKGKDGRDAKGNYLVCRSGPGNGSNGKRGGDGGDGGNAGSGSNGGDIIIMGKCQAIERMSYAEYNQKGGKTGKIGIGGQVGDGGPGGRKGSTSGTRCDDDGRNNGSTGSKGNNRGRNGKTGKNGQDGELSIFLLPDLQPIAG